MHIAPKPEAHAAQKAAMPLLQKAAPHANPAAPAPMKMAHSDLHAGDKIAFSGGKHKKH